jgi:hypothetical protein
VSVRLDGATRGDRAEAAALLAAGGVLLTLPFVAVVDRMGDVWFGAMLLAAGAGVFIGGLGVRWFITEGPALIASSAEGHVALVDLPVVELPATLRLVEASSRLGAHALRFAALGSLLVLLVVEVGVLKWGAVGLFLLSFVADHVLLRPHRFVIDRQGLRPEGLGRKSIGLEWDDVEAMYWRWYPATRRPPFPSGERIIVERKGEGRDLEFVFHRRYGGSSAAMVVRAAVPLLGDRVRVLSPGTTERVEFDTPPVSQAVE